MTSGLGPSTKDITTLERGGGVYLRMFEEMRGKGSRGKGRHHFSKIWEMVMSFLGRVTESRMVKDMGEGGVKKPGKVVTSFMDGPFQSSDLTLISFFFITYKSKSLRNNKKGDG